MLNNDCSYHCEYRPLSWLLGITASQSKRDVKVTPAYCKITSAKITLHNSLSPSLIISNQSVGGRDRARTLGAHDWAGHIGTALAECAGVIARYWITVGIPYVIFFPCISFTRRIHESKTHQLRPSGLNSNKSRTGYEYDDPAAV